MAPDTAVVPCVSDAVMVLYLTANTGQALIAPSSHAAPPHLNCFLPALCVQDRYKLIEKEIERPRVREKQYMIERMNKPADPFRYAYDQEAFSVRRKEFWPLEKARKLLQEFIPTLSHESDGLILQVMYGAVRYRIKTTVSGPSF